MTEYLTLTEAGAALRAGEVTSLELVRRALAVAEAVDDSVGSLLTRFADEALAAAAAADAAMQAGEQVGPLHGLPLGVKDLISTAEAPSTAQSLVLDPGWNNGDAVAAARIRRAGGLVLAKTTMSEFAVGTPDASKPFPIPRNPWNPERWAGGSSSGSASAVAIGAVLGALGTDTAGSIRFPAAFCGVTGLMPTFGRVPKSGCVPLGYSLDRVGPLARSAKDCALMLSVLAGPDPSDHCSIDEPVPDYQAELNGRLDGLRIGIDRLSRFSGANEDPSLPAVFDAAVTVLAGLGARIVEIELPLYQELTAATLVSMAGEGLAYHRPDLQMRWDDYGFGTRVLLATGVFYSAADAVQALRVRRVGQRILADRFRDVDLIATPTASAGASSFADLDAMLEGVAGGGYGPIHTPYWNGTGHPVINVPMGFTADDMPLGLQIAGRPFDEVSVLRAADAFQVHTAWHLERPPILPTSAGRAG